MPEVVIRALIDHEGRLVKSKSANTYGRERLALVVAVIRKDGITKVLVDGKEVRFRKTSKPLEVIADEKFKKEALRRSMQL